MKYVKKRDSFLTGIREYRETDSYKNLELIQEDGGPLHNAVEFGDSWVGRWIHNIMRAAKEKVDKMRIAGQIRRLKMALDDIIQNDEAVKMEIIKTSKKEPGQETTDPLKGDDLHDKFLRLQLHVFLDELNAAVEKGHKVSIIKSLTDNAIEEVEKTPEFEGKKELLEQLKKFKEFLKDFDDDEGKEDPDFKQEKGEGDDDEEGDEEDEEKESGDDESKKLFTMIESLKYLSLIIETYKRVKIESKTTQKEVYTYITKPGDTIEKIQKSQEINKNKLQITDIRKKNEKTLKNYAKDNQTLAPNLKLVMENVEVLFEDEDCFYILNGEDYIILEKETFGTGGSADRQTIKTSNQKGEPLKQGEDHLTQAFAKLKKDIEVLESEKEKGIGITPKFINDIVAGYKEPENRTIIRSLYSEINRYLVGDKKATIQEKDPLYKESIEAIKNLPKRVVVAEKIARFTKRAIQFDGENLYGGLGDLGKNLKGYVESMKKVMTYKLGESKEKGETKFKVGDLVTWTNKEGKTITKKIEKIEDGKYVFKKESGEEYTKKEDALKKAEPKKEGEPKKEEESKKEEAKKESRLLRYDNYYRLIREADDDKEGVLSEVSRKILEFWKANVEVKAYILSKEEFEKLLKELEDAELDQEVEMPVSEGDPKADKLPEPKKKKVKLTGLAFTIDPVLRIVKAFNKAYKLHTTEVIPSGRTTGAVSNRIFRQYTSLGSGTPDSAGKQGGPYRNNAVYNKWEEAVLDVMGESKYQKIFSPDTVLLRGEDLVEKAGANLRLFMSDLLDGEKLYKGSGSSTEKGAQSQFLDKYFGWKGDDKVLYDGADKEFKETQKVATEVDKKTNEQIVSFTKDDIKFTQVSELVGTMFKLEDADEDKSYYFYIHELAGDYYYVTYTRGYKFYHDLIHKEGKYGFPDLSKIKGDGKTPNDSYSSGDGEWVIRATKIATRNFDTKTGKLKPATYESVYIRKKDKKPFTNKQDEVEKSSEKDKLTAKAGKIFILSVKKDKDDKEPKFATIEKKDNLKEKGIFPSIRNTKNITDNDVIFKIG